MAWLYVVGAVLSGRVRMRDEVGEERHCREICGEDERGVGRKRGA